MNSNASQPPQWKGKRVASSFLQPIGLTIHMELNALLPVRNPDERDGWGAEVVDAIHRHIADALREICVRLRPLEEAADHPRPREGQQPRMPVEPTVSPAVFKSGRKT